MTAIPDWRWPNVLSLDAPLIAVAWQALLSEWTGCSTSAARTWGARVRGTSSYRRHRRLATAGAAAILAVDGLLILFELNPAVFHFGLAVLAGVILYFWVLHATAVPFPKQVAEAALFTMGTFLVAFARSRGHGERLMLAAGSFALLCLANLVAIEYGESPPATLGPMVRALGAWHCIWLPGMALVFLWAMPGQWSSAVATSAMALTVIQALNRRLSQEVRRALLDAAIFAPPLLLLL